MSSSPPQSTGVFARLAKAVLQYRGVVVGLILLSMLAAGVGIAQSTVDFSSQRFYGDASQDAKQLSRFHQEFGSDDDQLYVLAELYDAGTVVEARHLAALERLAAAIEARPGVDAVVHAGRIPGLSLDMGSPVVPGLVSADGRSTVLIVHLARSSDDVLSIRPLVQGIQEAVDAADSSPMKYTLAGVPAIRAAFVDLTLRDQMTFVPLTLLLIGAALAAVFRRIHAVVVPAVAAGFPTILLLGAMGWAGEPIGLLNQAYFTLLPVLAVAGAIHMVSRVHEVLRRAATLDQGAKRRAIVEAGGTVGTAITLATATTALGFASLALAEMPILRSFGLWAALGMGFAWLGAVVLVPLLLSFVRVSALDQLPRPRTTFVEGCADLATRRPAAVLVATALIALWTGWGATRVVVDNKLGDLLDARHDIRLASEHVDQRLGGTLSIEVVLRGRPGDEAPDPRSFLEAARGLEDARVVLGPGDDLENRTHADPANGSRTWVTIRTADLGGLRFEHDVGRIRALLEDTAPGVEAEVVGTSLLAYRGVNRITHDLRRSLALVFFVVIVTIGLLFRSPWMALVSIVPNALPLLVAYGLVGMAGFVLDPLATVIMALALGVAVDDTIHLLARTREQLRAGDEPNLAIRTAARHTGQAVTVTSLVLAGGLAVNLFSSFPPLRMLGFLGSVAILAALVADVLLLPALLVLMRRGLAGPSASRL